MLTSLVYKLVRYLPVIQVASLNCTTLLSTLSALSVHLSHVSIHGHCVTHGCSIVAGPLVVFNPISTMVPPPLRFPPPLHFKGVSPLFQPAPSLTLPTILVPLNTPSSSHKYSRICDAFGPQISSSP
jgi:hypothetical protein